MLQEIFLEHNIIKDIDRMQDVRLIFHKEAVENKYKNVLYVCSLKPIHRRRQDHFEINNNYKINVFIVTLSNSFRLRSFFEVATLVTLTTDV